MCKKIGIHSTRRSKSSFLHITVTRESLGITKIMEVAEEWPCVLFTVLNTEYHLVHTSVSVGVLVIVWVFW